MKKVLPLTGLILIIFLLAGCGIFNLNGWLLPNDIGFMQVVENLRTPQEISDYMIENFTYEIHDFTAQTPYELYISKKGDCDEFSDFGVFFADYHGYETYQIEIFDNTLFQHYVAVYDEGIWYSITDNQNHYFGFDNFREIVDYVCNIRGKVWVKYIVQDYWDNIISEVNQ